MAPIKQGLVGSLRTRIKRGNPERQEGARHGG
jgi:hypothetical protein